MAHIGVITTGLTGILHASFEVVARLQKEGHKVTYLCPWDVRERVEKMGFTYFQLPEVNFYFWNFDKETGYDRSYKKRILFHLKNIWSKNERGIKALQIEKFKAGIQAVGADRLLIDVELHELIFAAKEMHVDFTLLSQWFPNLKGRYNPPLTSTLMPKIGSQKSRFDIFAAWLVLDIKTRWRNFKNQLLLQNYRRFALKAYSRRLHFPINTLIPSFFPPLFIYKGLPMICMVMKEIEFPIPNQNRIKYAGAMVYDRRITSIEDDKDTIRLNAVLLKCKEPNKRLIYCSVSSLNSGDAIFIKNVLQAVAKEPDWLMIISLGGKLNAEEFGLVPKNVYLFDWVPQLQVLQQADCSINHGGIHTINECIHFSVPMLVYSGKRHDQNGCAARVAYHALGILGNKDTDSSLTIREKIGKVLNDPMYFDNIKSINKEYLEAKKRKLTELL